MAPQTRKLNKPLTCFYCNRKSSTRYDGSIRRFECHNCNATNHLDAKGDITDVPAAKTTTEASPEQFAILRSQSPTHGSGRVFCDKCLQNQHLFISSLAQYFPEDPDDPEYAAREKGYYKFYKGLMARYPQCCAECEPKVREQLAKAAYTAKTDHLRRMLDRTAKIRVITTRSPLYYCHSVGKWVWVTSLLFQLLWHMCLISQGIVARSSKTNERSWSIVSARAFSVFASYLPAPDRLLRWSFWTSAVSIWWNPKWVDTFKSNTKHLVGFSNYYRYQVLIFALKFATTLLISPLSDFQGPRLAPWATAHASMALFMLYLYRTARKTIRVDHTPLWITKSSSIGAVPSLPPSGAPPDSREDNKKSMADILDEILHEPTQKPQIQPQVSISQFSTPNRVGHLLPSADKSSYNSATREARGNPFGNLSSQRKHDSAVGLDGLSLSDSPRSRIQERLGYSRDMEWSPTQSKYRAFNTYKPGQTETRKFGETPTHEKAGVFWAKVPPAPTTPAQRLLNPPNAPLLRRSPRNVQNTIAFRGSKASPLSELQVEAPPATIFAEPTFRPAQPMDERDELLEKFQMSFSLDSVPAEEHETGEGQNQGSLSTAQASHGSLWTLRNGFLTLACVFFLAVLAERAYSDFAILWKSISILGR